MQCAKQTALDDKKSLAIGTESQAHKNRFDQGKMPICS